MGEDFTSISQLNNIARISTTSAWLSLPNVGPNLSFSWGGIGNINALVYAHLGPQISSEPTRLYVGGSIDFAGAIPVNNFAGWNGTAWESVGAGLDGPVYSLYKVTDGSSVSRSDSLYAGGAFTNSGSSAVAHIARLTGNQFNGYTWQSLGTGLNDNAYTMVLFNSSGTNLLVVGGAFTSAGGTAANHIAAWNPATSTWSTFDTGMNGPVFALAVWDPDGSGPLTPRLVAGGFFTSASGMPITNLAEWDGVQWQPFEGGGVNGAIRALTVWPDAAAPNLPRLVLGGEFSKAGTTAANCIAVWRSTGWDTAIGTGFTSDLEPSVFTLATVDLDGPNTSSTATLGTELIAGGNFTKTGLGDRVASIAKWDAAKQRWVTLDALTQTTGRFQPLGGSTVPIRAILPLPQAAGDRPRLLIGGQFSRLDAALDLDLSSGKYTYNQGLVVWAGTEPYVSSAPPAQMTNCPGSTVTLVTSVLGDSLAYRWQRYGTNLFPGLTGTGSLLTGVTASTLSISNCSAADAGPYTCDVFNTCGATTTSVAQVTVEAAGCPPAPQILTASPLPPGTVGMNYSLALTAQDGLPPYAWSVISGMLPDGVALSASGILSGTPTTPGVYNFTILLTDAVGESPSQAFVLTISPAPPTILTTSPLPFGTVGANYSLTLSAANGAAPYSWLLASGSLPPGLALAGTGLLSGTPTNSGTFNFTVRLSDSLGSNATTNLALTIYPAQLRIVSTSPLPSGTLANRYSFTFVASGGSAPYSWFLFGQLPPGLFMKGMGVFSGTPQATGSYNFLAQVTDSLGAMATVPCLITINLPGPTILGPAVLPSGTVGSPYNQVFSAVGGAFPYTWSLAAGALPEGVALDSGGALAGTPTNARTFDFMVLVSDLLGSTTTEAFEVTINPAQLAITTGSSLPSGTAGSNYSLTLSAADGSAPYSWVLASGSLPAGVTLFGTGLIDGIPTNTGTFNFTVQVSDSVGANTNKAFALTINPQPLAIATPSPLPTGTVLSNYLLTFNASGGIPPYFWSWFGAPPPGLLFNGAGVLMGVPTTPGDFNFSVQLRDSAGTFLTQPFALTISNLIQVALKGGEFRLQFVAVPGRAYSIQANSALDNPVGWTAISNVPPASFPSTITVLDSTPANVRFYRIMQSP
jgi:hypothetical protein